MPRKRTRSAPEPAPIQGEEPPMPTLTPTPTPTPKPEDPTSPIPSEPADGLLSDPETPDPESSAPETPAPDPRTSIPAGVLADLPLMQPADFGSVAIIDAELARLGDPWEEFKNGPVANLNASKAEREKVRKILDDAVNQAQLEHDRAREAMSPRYDRVLRLKIRRAELMH